MSGEGAAYVRNEKGSAKVMVTQPSAQLGQPHFQMKQSRLGLPSLTLSNKVLVTKNLRQQLKNGLCTPALYTIKDEGTGTVICQVEEDANSFCMCICGPGRNSKFNLYNLSKNVAARFDRAPCRCDCCCCWDCFICTNSLVVTGLTGEQYGQVTQRFHVFSLKMDVRNGSGDLIAVVRGPCFPWRACREATFNVWDPEEKEIQGAIEKVFIPNGPCVNMDHENFTVTFPVHFDETERILLLGSAYLVNLMYMDIS